MGPNCKSTFIFSLSDQNVHFLNEVTYLNLHSEKSQIPYDDFFCESDVQEMHLPFIPSHFVKLLIYSLFPNTLCLSIFFLLKGNPKQTTFFPR